VGPHNTASGGFLYILSVILIRSSSNSRRNILSLRKLGFIATTHQQQRSCSAAPAPTVLLCPTIPANSTLPHHLTICSESLNISHGLAAQSPTNCCSIIRAASVCHKELTLRSQILAYFLRLTIKYILRCFLSFRLQSWAFIGTQYRHPSTPKTFLAAWYISLPQPHGGGGGLDHSEGESDRLSRYTVSTLSQETMEYSLDR